MRVIPLDIEQLDEMWILGCIPTNRFQRGYLSLVASCNARFANMG
jgi:hypothetical protein